MPQLEVMLEVPTKIAAGLASGQLERVGGVVREAGSKQIVAWLREGGSFAANPAVPKGLLSTLLQSAGSMTSVTGVLKLGLKAYSHHVIMGTLQSIRTMVMFTGGIGILNAALSAYTLFSLTKRVNQLEERIIELGDSLRAEFDHDRAANLKAGLEAAQDAAAAHDIANKREHALQAIFRLREARQTIHKNVRKQLTQHSDMTRLHLLQAMQVDFVNIRCYLEIDDIENANRHTENILKEYRELTRQAIHILLGSQRAIYFHKSVDDDDLWRFVHIKQWLSDKVKDKHVVLAENAMAYRGDFWDMDIVKDIRELDLELAAREAQRAARERLLQNNPEHLEAMPPHMRALAHAGKFIGSFQPLPEMPTHLAALAHAEMIIESYQSIQGIQAEIGAIQRLPTPSFAHWRALSEEAIAASSSNVAQHEDYVLVVDNDALRHVTVV